MRALLTVIALCLTSVAVPATQAQDNLPDAVQALILEAREEGSINIFGPTLNPRQIRAFEASYNDYYGLDIDFTMSGGPHALKSAEIAMAARAGVPTGIDLFWSGQLMAALDADAFRKVDWAGTYGADPELIMGEWGLRTHDGHQSMITLNTRRVSIADGPKTYWDLLDPKWRGQIVMPRTSYPWVAMTYAIGEEDMTRLLTRLVSEQEPKMLVRYADIRSRVLSGEYAIAIGTDIFRQKGRGAPVDHADMDLLVLSSSGAFVLKDAAHPAAAILWGLWAVSPEGQATLEEQHGYSLVTTPGTAMNRYAEGRRAVNAPFDWRVQNFDRLTAKYRDILDPGS